MTGSLPREGSLTAPLRLAPLHRTAFALSVLAIAFVPMRARAWTRTEVSAMKAHAEVSRFGVARISLELRVEVRGGWVERFELAGLGPSVRVDSGKPPTWIAEDGRKHAPLASLSEDGTLLLEFGDRAQAPHRGSYRALVIYETQLAPSDKAADALVLRLPAWPAALENVELWIDAPSGARLLDAGNAGPEERKVLERGALTVLHLTRAQLPRTEPLEAELVLPGAPGRLRDRVAHKASSAAGSSHAQSWNDALWAALAVLVLLACKRGLNKKDATHAIAMPDDAVFRAAARLDLARAKRSAFLRLWGPASWLDATTPLGCVLFAVAGGLAAFASTRADAARLEPFIAAFLIAAPLWLIGTRRARMPDADDALLALLAGRKAIAQAARALGARAILEVAASTTCGPIRFARLRIATREHSHALSLVLAYDHSRERSPTLAWIAPHDGASASVPIATQHPADDLADLLAHAARSSSASDSELLARAA